MNKDNINNNEITEENNSVYDSENNTTENSSENNFEEDYTDIKYSCSKCNDTGITEDGTRCSCTKQRIGEAEIWQNLSSEKR